MKFVIYPDTNRDQIKSAITGYIDGLSADKCWQVVIGKFDNSRSAKQNRALFGLAYLLLEQHTGIIKDDLHEYYCMKFFGTQCRVVFGRKKFVPIRTTTTDESGNRSLISTTEFCKFYEFVQMEGAKLGCIIPEPQEKF